MSDEDYELALKLQMQFNEEGTNTSVKKRPNALHKKQPTTSIVDSEWETSDPNPDIHQLFRVFDIKFFWNSLGVVEVKWSPRMYTCAGICTYKGKGGCVVSLSLPLLKFRPRKDLIETLLHEMIHAYLFVTKNNKDRVSHGTEFCKHMDRINKEAGTHITIYHSFHDEVNHYKTHIWRCNGSCRANPPYFGYVRRAVNRAPGPNDFWFPEHKRSCGGSFEKVGEPDNFKARPRKKVVLNSSGATTNLAKKTESSLIAKKNNDIRNFVQNKSKNNSSATKSTVTETPATNAIHGVKNKTEQRGSIVKHGGVKNNIFGFGSLTGGGNERSENEIISKSPVSVSTSPFSGKGYVLGSSGVNDKRQSRLLMNLEANQNTSNIPQANCSGPSNSKIGINDSYYLNCNKKRTKDSYVADLTHLDSEEEDDSPLSNLHCPVCNVKIKGATINEHLDECAQLDSIVNSCVNEVFSDSSDSDNEFYRPHSPPSPEPPTTEPSSPPLSCPNCSTKVTSSTINQHLDQCLSFD